MKIFSANWILPIVRPPIRHGAVAVDDRRLIRMVAPVSDVLASYPGAEVKEFEDSVILPGLVNAHTHLELSMMRGQLPINRSFPDWAYEAITRRSEFTPEQTAVKCREGMEELRRCGTIAVGDIANHSDSSWAELGRSGLYGIRFHEVTGFPPDMAEARFEEFRARVVGPESGKVSQSMAPHAPYSVSPQLIRMIGGYCAENGLRTTIHLAESADEVEFIHSGSGGFKELLTKLGRWDPAWPVPGVSPVQYLDRMGFLNERMMAVHCVHVNEDDLFVLRDRGVSVCTCPRSNSRIDTGGVAPVTAMVRAGLTVCLGTDSLASNDDLNLWNEMADLRVKHPGLAPDQVLRMATLNGARALGLDDRLGSVEAGKEAALVRVVSKDRVDHPEEFLTSGFGEIEWVGLL